MAVACGGSSSSPSSSHTSAAPSASSDSGKYLAFDRAGKTATLTVIASATSKNGGLNFDGATNGSLTFTIPRGWQVTVHCLNRGGLNHSCAIVKTAAGTTPAFPGASTPNPMVGVSPGGQASFTFTPDTVGTYRIACLVPGHEAAGMWVRFAVAGGGTPRVGT